MVALAYVFPHGPGVVEQRLKRALETSIQRSTLREEGADVKPRRLSPGASHFLSASQSEFPWPRADVGFFF